jgi:hypothetical protein
MHTTVACLAPNSTSVIMLIMLNGPLSLYKTILCVDIGLHLSLAAKYLTMQGCYRSVSHTFSNFKLDDLVDLENLTANLNSKGTKPSRPLLFHPGSPCFNSVSNLNQAGLLSTALKKIITALKSHMICYDVNLNS